MRRPTGTLGNLAVAAFRTTVVLAVVGAAASALAGLAFLVGVHVLGIAVAVAGFLYTLLFITWPDDRDGWWYTKE